jgi:hypothetical protein
MQCPVWEMHKYMMWQSREQNRTLQAEAGITEKYATLRVGESAYLSFTCFQPVTALKDPLCFIYWDSNCMGRGPLSKAQIRAINQEALYLLRVCHWSIF